jgi:hypothetical protein
MRRNTQENSFRSKNTTGHFHVLRCLLALVHMLVVNWGLVKEGNRSLHHGHIARSTRRGIALQNHSCSL